MINKISLFLLVFCSLVVSARCQTKEFPSTSFQSDISKAVHYHDNALLPIATNYFDEAQKEGIENWADFRQNQSGTEVILIPRGFAKGKVIIIGKNQKGEVLSLSEVLVPEIVEESDTYSYNKVDVKQIVENLRRSRVFGEPYRLVIDTSYVDDGSSIYGSQISLIGGNVYFHQPLTTNSDLSYTFSSKLGDDASREELFHLFSLMYVIVVGISSLLSRKKKKKKLLGFIERKWTYYPKNINRLKKERYLRINLIFLLTTITLAVATTKGVTYYQSGSFLDHNLILILIFICFGLFAPNAFRDEIAPLYLSSKTQNFSRKTWSARAQILSLPLVYLFFLYPGRFLTRNFISEIEYGKFICVSGGVFLYFYFLQKAYSFPQMTKSLKNSDEVRIAELVEKKYHVKIKSIWLSSAPVYWNLPSQSLLIPQNWADYLSETELELTLAHLSTKALILSDFNLGLLRALMWLGSLIFSVRLIPIGFPYPNLIEILRYFIAPSFLYWLITPLILRRLLRISILTADYKVSRIFNDRVTQIHTVLKVANSWQEHHICYPCLMERCAAIRGNVRRKRRGMKRLSRLPAFDFARAKPI